MNEAQIRQIIGQLESSIDRIERNLTLEEFQDYCDNAYSCIAYWRGELKKLNDDASS